MEGSGKVFEFNFNYVKWMDGGLRNEKKFEVKGGGSKEVLSSVVVDIL